VSYERMVEREKHLEAEIEQMLTEAKLQDAAEDERSARTGAMTICRRS
jgi:hypothetical protein